MSPLPLLISLPHAGLRIPPELAAINLLSPEAIAADGDEGAAEIYGPLQDAAAAYVTSAIARAFVDLNRAEDDFRKDGVVKTHTCWDVPIYREPLDAELTERLLERYHRPYHQQLSAAAREEGILCGVDCHTMAAVAPPVAPDPGQRRPWVCIGDGDGSCPRPWAEALRDTLAEAFDGDARLNDPFRGGHIIRHHAQELPWIMIELSRSPAIPRGEITERLMRALGQWVTVITDGEP